MAYKEIPDVWPDEKLEREMLLQATIVAKRAQRSSQDTTADDVVCHVKALLCRVRDLEQCVEAQQKEIASLRKEIEQRDMHEMGRLDVGEKDRIDRWRTVIREALRLYRLECKTSAEIKLESLLGEEWQRSK